MARHREGSSIGTRASYSEEPRPPRRLSHARARCRDRARGPQPLQQRRQQVAEHSRRTSVAPAARRGVFGRSYSPRRRRAPPIWAGAAEPPRCGFSRSGAGRRRAPPVRRRRRRGLAAARRRRAGFCEDDTGGSMAERPLRGAELRSPGGHEACAVHRRAAPPGAGNGGRCRAANEGRGRGRRLQRQR